MATKRRAQSALVLNSQPRPDWMFSGACRDTDPELFFIKNPEPAKTVCEECSIADVCLKFALTNGIDDGVWGGLSESERRALKTTPNRPRPGFSRGKLPAA